ncbi:carbamoyltransferase HypF [Brevibacillus sp. SYSU BS000544]|uniref:carbamoyltransferase HypF n=1 Tax=Brevibacillus sp. SYSU BS000544 TaxID=3416443 RepID=UPI003CE5C555
MSQVEDQTIAHVTSQIQALQLSIQGRVQGIGFRPELFRRAADLSLFGWVQNDPSGVLVHIEGNPDQVKEFARGLLENPPPLATYISFEEIEAAPEGWDTFFIKESKQEGAGLTDISPDLALCPACQSDMISPDNRRYNYPFTTCTYCGPRYTFIEQMPYDRPFTTMAHFPLCPDCKTEYKDPFDRRFHAQPIACPTCGPGLRMYQRSAEGSESPWQLLDVNVSKEARAALRAGAVLAIKGLGGYHLAVDAHHSEAVELLRKRKRRPDKPLALMMKDLSEVETHCYLSEDERELLLSQKAPIVLLQKREETHKLAHSIAPASTKLGVMLPYTPLHHLLLNEDLPVLVMTSANLSGQPLIADESVWFAEPAAYQLVDYLITDNRPIANPIDDSVVHWNQGTGQQTILRRARGYIPESVPVHFDTDGILAVGAEQHAAFALGRGNRMYHGPYTGTLSNVEIQERYLNTLERYKLWYGKEFTHIACDMHPEYWSTGLAKQIAESFEIPVIPVQHHHAHMASVMTEHGLTDDCLAIVLDGTGYGLDGTIWGMEVLHGSYTSFTRVASLQPIPLPGGEKAIRETWRTAAAMLLETGDEAAALDYLASLGKEEESAILFHMQKRGINTPRASSCGRLFDGISALLGICQYPTFDGQAAIELTECANQNPRDVINGIEQEAYPLELQMEADVPTDKHPWLKMNWRSMVTQIQKERLNGDLVHLIAEKFHRTIVHTLVKIVTMATSEIAPSEWRQTKSIVLSGGSMQNPILLEGLTKELTEAGFQVYQARTFPSGDGGIAIGQLAVASAKRKKA